MKKSMMEILACPIDKHNPLELSECSSSGERIVEGALYCTKCSRFYPIMDEIPIMLPDYLRDKKEEIEFLEKNRRSLPEDITERGLPWHL